MEFSFILTVTKLRYKKILLHPTSFYSSELFLLMLQVLILNSVLMKKVADLLPVFIQNIFLSSGRKYNL